jgi:hypothetical protein
MRLWGLLPLFIFMTLVGEGLSQEHGMNVLHEYQWKNRILLVFAQSQEDTTFQSFKKQLLDVTDMLCLGKRSEAGKDLLALYETLCNALVDETG